MEFTAEQKVRMMNHRTQFARFMLEGTIAHCRKLYNSKMVSEACTILQEVSGKSQVECLKILEG